jgi:hypothetical protein
MIVPFGFLSAWISHTEDSRAYARDIVDALADARILHKEAWRVMRLSNEQQLSRQLAGSEPLNAYRLTYLPSAFHVAFLRRQAVRLGAAVIASEELSLIRGAAVLGPDRVDELIPARRFTRTITLPFGQEQVA